MNILYTLFLTVSNNSEAYRPADVTELVLDVRNIVIAIVAGFVIAVFSAFYSRFVAGRAVRALMEANAYCEADAKSVEELSLRFAPYHRHCLEKGYPQRNIVARTEDGRYYIKEEQRLRAQKNYSSKENGAVVVFSAVIIMLAVIGALWFGGDAMAEKINGIINSVNSPDVSEAPDGDEDNTAGTRDEESEEGENGGEESSEKPADELTEN